MINDTVFPLSLQFPYYLSCIVNLQDPYIFSQTDWRKESTVRINLCYPRVYIFYRIHQSDITHKFIILFEREPDKQDIREKIFYIRTYFFCFFFRSSFRTGDWLFASVEKNYRACNNSQLSGLEDKEVSCMHHAREST